jgi:carbon-monoxide dehydrogenase small subunit
MRHEVLLKVNGDYHTISVESQETLLDVLRKGLGLTGTKKGCDSGDCGACTVILDKKSVASCLILAVEANGCEITTIEGMKKGGILHPLQTAFIERGAIQCGFCAPGMILSAQALLEDIPSPSEEQIRKAISGNLCRCTGYKKIVEAIATAAETIRNEKDKRKS